MLDRLERISAYDTYNATEYSEILHLSAEELHKGRNLKKEIINFLRNDWALMVDEKNQVEKNDCYIDVEKKLVRAVTYQRSVS